MARIKKLDLYIAGTFLGPFLLCLVGFAGLYVVIDFFSNIDEFLVHDSVLEMFRLTVVYYTLRLPSYLSQIMPVLTVMPAVICMIRLQRGNELCAIRASGVSARRISAPIILCGVGVMILAALNQEVLVPALHGPLMSAERRARRAKSKRIGLSHAVDRSGRFLLIGAYDRDTPLPALTDIRITWNDRADAARQEPREKWATRAFVPRLPGEWDEWGTWYMENVREYDSRNNTWRKREPESFTSPATARLVKKYQDSRDRGKAALVATDRKGTSVYAYQFGSYTEEEQRWPVARDVEIIHPSQPEKGRVSVDMMVWVGDRWRMFGVWRFRGGYDPETLRQRHQRLPDGRVFDSSLRPSDVQAGEFKRASAMMTLVELADIGSRFPSRRFRHRCWVIIWSRLAFPLANVVLALLTLPLVFRQSSHATLLGISLAVLMTLLYMTSNLISIDLAYRQWPVWRWPLFAGTFPTVLFGVPAVWLFARMDRV